MKRLASGFLFLAALIASPVLANAPSTMSYQGVLSDAAGNIAANGLYNFTFNIYTVPVNGAAIWTETQNNIQVTLGGFSVILGSVTPLNLTFDAQYYLGIVVNGGPELSPRVTLASSPYALGLHLPFSLSTNPGTPLITGLDYAGGFGGALEGLDPSGSATWRLEPDISGSGGFLAVERNTFNTLGFYVDGNTAGSNNTLVQIQGAATAMTFNTNTTGDASVVLPANAISAAEILDEPGIAQNHVNGGVSFVGATVNTGDILSVTITTPASGYIVVTADTQLQLFNPTQSAIVQITETSNAAVDGPHYFGVGGPTVNGAGAATVTPTWAPVSIHRTYFKAAGAYTFYFQALNNSSSATAGAWNPTITALYAPTSYGSVISAPAVAERSQFDRITPTTSVGNGPGQPSVSGELVDLRDLELKATRAREVAERAQRELIQAELARQLNSNARPAAAKKN